MRIDRDALRYQPREFYWAGLSAVALVVAPFGPWIAAFSGQGVISGLRGRGWLVLAAGIVGLLVLAALHARLPRARWGLVPMAGAGLYGAYLCWDFIDSIHAAQGPSIPTIGHLIQPGWGVVLGLAGSLSLAAAALWALYRPPADWR
jgi:hypothetical protein